MANELKLTMINQVGNEEDDDGKEKEVKIKYLSQHVRGRHLINLALL